MKLFYHKRGVRATPTPPKGEKHLEPLLMSPVSKERISLKPYEGRLHFFKDIKLAGAETTIAVSLKKQQNIFRLSLYSRVSHESRALSCRKSLC